MANADIKEISKLLDEKLAPIKETLNDHGKILNEHGKRLDKHDSLFNQIIKTLQQHGKLLRSLKKDQSTMLVMLDKEQMNQRKRIRRIEEHLDLPPTS